MSPGRLLWVSGIVVLAALVYGLCGCGGRELTPAQSAAVTLVGVCEAQVLIAIEKSDTRDDLCKLLGAATTEDLCYSYIQKAKGRLCQ